MREKENLKVDTRVGVETPEGVDFQFVIAGPGTRAYAWLVDMLFKAAILSLLYVVVAAFAMASIQSLGLTEGVLLICTFLLDWFYGSYFESTMNGQTPG